MSLKPENFRKAGIKRRLMGLLLIFTFVLALDAAAATVKAVDGSAKADDPLSKVVKEGEEGAGQEPIVTSVTRVTLGELIELALKNNPRLKALRLNWQRTIQRYPQATALDDPTFTYTYPIEEVETRLGPQEQIFMLSQKLPFPGKLGLKGDIVKKDIEIARAVYDKALRDLKVRVKQAFFDLNYIDHAITLTGENKAVLDYFRDVSRANYGINVSELDELVRAQKLQAKAAVDLIVLNDTREGIVARLNTLLDRAPTHYIGIGQLEDPTIESFRYVVDELYVLASHNYDELKIAGLKVEKSTIENKLSGYAYRPDFRLGLNYSVIGEPPMASIDGAGRDAVSVSVGVNIPLWFKKNRAKVTEASLLREKNIIEERAVLREVENDIKRVYFDLTSAEALVKLYGESLVPEAKESLDFAEARYRSGEERLGRLLETQSMWLNFRLVYYRAVSDYFKAASELERLTGSELL